MEEKNHFKNGLKTFKAISLSIGFVVLCLIALVALSSRFNLPGGYRAYSVLTGSMEPVIQTGSLIFTQSPKSTEEIKVNSVITFEEPGYENKFITHRVAQVVNNNPGVIFKTMGDANKSEDPWLIPYGRIKGIYLAHLPYLGTLLESIKSPAGIIIFISLPVLLIVADESKNIVSALADIKIEKERKKRDHGTNSHIFMWVILLPLIGFGIGQTRALFFTSPVSLNNNTLTVAQATSSPDPSTSPSSTPSPSQSPEPSVSPNPSASPSPSPSGIIIEGNGEGSENNVDVENNTNCEVNQDNNSNTDLNIDSGSNSGSNDDTSNTGGSAQTNTGDSSSSVDLNITGGSSSSGCN